MVRGPGENVKGKVIAVLTGDLVRSREMTADQIATVRATLDAAVQEIDRWSPGLVLGGPQFFRGDSWQIALSEPGYFLRAAMGLRAVLRAMDMRAETRIGIGIGQAERVDPQEISLSVGEAFILSGGALDTIKGSVGLSIALNDRDRKRLPLLGPLVATCDELIGRLQPAQAETVWLSLALPAPSQQDVARKRGITRQTASDALAVGGFRALAEAAAGCETLDWPVHVSARSGLQ